MREVKKSGKVECTVVTNHNEQAQIEYEKQKKRFFKVKMTNEYYKEKNFLILSARKGEQRIATVLIKICR